jgi:hypothetical protein
LVYSGSYGTSNLDKESEMWTTYFTTKIMSLITRMMKLKDSLRFET